jgi:hypothetical protein
VFSAEAILRAALNGLFSPRAPEASRTTRFGPTKTEHSFLVQNSADMIFMRVTRMPREECRMNPPLPTPWKPTKTQILAASEKLVPDIIARNLITLFVGINPGLYTA